MTVLAALTRADRRCLLERLDDAAELDRLMRERGGLPSVPEPVPLHRTGRDEPTGA
jgi:hypothetical protein